MMHTERGIYTPSKTTDPLKASLFISEEAAYEAAKIYPTYHVACCDYFHETGCLAYWVYYLDNTYLKLSPISNDNEETT